MQTVEYLLFIYMDVTYIFKHKIKKKKKSHAKYDVVHADVHPVTLYSRNIHRHIRRWYYNIMYLYNNIHNI